MASYVSAYTGAQIDAAIAGAVGLFYTDTDSSIRSVVNRDKQDSARGAFMYMKSTSSSTSTVRGFLAEIKRTGTSTASIVASATHGHAMNDALTTTANSWANADEIWTGDQTTVALSESNLFGNELALISQWHDNDTSFTGWGFVSVSKNRPDRQYTNSVTNLAYIAATQTPVSSANLTLATTAATLDTPTKLRFTFIGDCSGITFTTHGTSDGSTPASEAVSGGTTSTTVDTNLYYKTNTSIAVTGSVGGAASVKVGLAGDTLYANGHSGSKGNNAYNRNTSAFVVSGGFNQDRPTSGAFSGWERGIYFQRWALDKSIDLNAIGIDMSDLEETRSGEQYIKAAMLIPRTIPMGWGESQTLQAGFSARSGSIDGGGTGTTLYTISGGSATSVAASQNPAINNGVLLSDGVVTLGSAEVLKFTFTGSASGVNFRITGTSDGSTIISETLAGTGSSTTKNSVNLYKTIYAISATGDAGTMSVGTAGTSDVSVATSQNPILNGSIKLTTATVTLNQSVQIAMSFTDDCRGVTYTVTGTSDGTTVITETVSGGAAGTNTVTTSTFKTVYGIATFGDSGTITAGTLGFNVMQVDGNRAAFQRGLCIGYASTSGNSSPNSTVTVIEVTSTASARTITLPTTVLAVGQIIIVKDGSAGASTHNITLNAGTNTIEGSSTYAISTDGGCVWILWNGSRWIILSKY